MTRIHGSEYREAIGRAIEICGPVMARLGHVQFVCGVDPYFIGLHRASESDVSYREVAHCCWPYHIEGPADRRVTTVVIPWNRWHRSHPWWLAESIVHELGHALHWTLDLDRFDVAPVTAYARTNRYEAFAEAFTSWRWGPGGYGDWPDSATLSLFRSLA